jgi:hypothetical protein
MVRCVDLWSGGGGYKCGPEEKQKSPCECADSGRLCDCKEQRFCEDCPSECKTSAVEDWVRVYDINPLESDWKQFFDYDYYHASNKNDFNDLKIKLAPDLSGCTPGRWPQAK